MPEAIDLELAKKGEQVLLRLRVRPGSRANEIVGIHAGSLKCRVTAAPEKGKANRAVVKLLTTALGLPKRAVALAAGRSSPDKVVAISDLDSEELRSRISRALA